MRGAEPEATTSAVWALQTFSVNGVGKSSIFRTLGGLWSPTSSEPHADATVALPKSLIFVPQRTYLTDGSLHDQLTYPDTAPHRSQEAEGAAIDLLRKVGLGKLLERFELHDEEDWAAVLSGGEKQRLAWARLFLAKPEFAMVHISTQRVP